MMSRPGLQSPNLTSVFCDLDLWPPRCKTSASLHWNWCICFQNIALTSW